MLNRPLLALALIPLLACSGGDETTDSDPTGTGHTGTLPDTVVVAAHVTLWPDGGDLAGAAVCWRRPAGDLCGATTDPSGAVALELPAGEAGQLTFESPPLVPTAMPMVLGDYDVFLDVGLDGAAFLASLYTQAGVTQDPAHGTVTFVPFGSMGAIGDATLALTPASGQGPLYLDASGLQLDLAATSTVPGVGVGYFLDVDPADGPFEVGATLSSSAACDTPLLGEALEPFEVLPGFEHFVMLSCD